jgi:hypothetical protein
VLPSKRGDLGGSAEGTASVRPTGVATPFKEKLDFQAGEVYNPAVERFLANWSS